MRSIFGSGTKSVNSPRSAPACIFMPSTTDWPLCPTAKPLLLNLACLRGKGSSSRLRPLGTTSSWNTETPIGRTSAHQPKGPGLALVEEAMWGFSFAKTYTVSSCSMKVALRVCWEPCSRHYKESRLPCAIPISHQEFHPGCWCSGKCTLDASRAGERRERLMCD